MCGLAGWFSPSPIAADQRPQLEAMIGSIAHRGPDDNGCLLQDHAALGHVRLSIIDIAGGHQPMTDEERPVSIVFNGEIYNFMELRDRLIRRGIRFRTRCDTEVILQIYLHDGPQGFSQLRGMFAFAIWDGRNNIGLLVRDPCGIKPLFLTVKSNGELQFASEAKAILAKDAAGVGELNETALHLLMNFRYLPGDLSLFRNIRQLSPGTVLEWRKDGTIQETPLSSAVSTSSSENVLGTLEESIKLHFTADVEVGTYLSGGLDSALIASLGRDSGHPDLRTFTLDVGDDANESRNAARTAELLGIQNLLGNNNTDLNEILPRLIWHLEIPKVNALQVNQLARHAAQHVKVVLSGVGGDELFLGYNAHRIMYFYDKAHSLLPTSISRPIGNLGAGMSRSLRNTVWSETERAAHMFAALGNWPRVYGLMRNIWDSPKLRRMIYGPRMLDAKLPDAFTSLQGMWPQGSDPVVAMAEFEWRNKMVNDLLWQEDRASMAEGLEVRVPFVDTRVVDHVWALGRERLMPRGKPKGYMRSMLEDVLPREVLTRPKSGFQVDAPVFFNRFLKPLAQTWLSEDRIKEYGLFNPAFVQRVLKYGTHTGLRWHYFILYLMLTTHIWLATFEQKSCRPVN